MSYVAPSILTLTAAPEYAKAGSAKPDPWGGWQKPGRSADGDIDLGRGQGGAGSGKGKAREHAAPGKDDKAASATAPEPGRRAKAEGKPTKPSESARANAEGTPAKPYESARATGAAPRASGPASPEA
jgi:hypothetical protein